MLSFRSLYHSTIRNKQECWLFPLSWQLIYWTNVCLGFFVNPTSLTLVNTSRRQKLFKGVTLNTNQICKSERFIFGCKRWSILNLGPCLVSPQGWPLVMLQGPLKVHRGPHINMSYSPCSVLSGNFKYKDVFFFFLLLHCSCVSRIKSSRTMWHLRYIFIT